MRRDFEKYLVAVQKQKTRMDKALADAQELAQKGELEDSVAQNIMQRVQVIEANYQRLLYCKHLLNLPPRFIQKIQEKKWLKIQKEFEEQKADKESVVNENEVALDEITGELSDLADIDDVGDGDGDGE